MRSMRLVKGICVIIAICVLALMNVIDAKAGVATYSGKVKSVDTATHKLIVTTGTGEDVTIGADEKTSVTIIDVDGAKTKADIGSILSVEKDGADKADSVEISADDATKIAKSITATTTRRMTLTKEEIEKKIAVISEGNKGVAAQVKIKADSPGIIKGSVRIMARTSEDAIVYIEKLNDNNFTPVAKLYVPQGDANVLTKEKGSKPEFPLMDQVNITFTPHVLPVLKGSIVDFPNSDTVRHNVFSPDPLPGKSEKINLGTYDVGIIKTVKMENVGELALLCNVHAEMSGFIVAIENPYFTLTDRKGAFTVENVPPGKYTLKTWHDRFQPVSAEVTVESGQTVEVILPTMKQKK